MGLKEEMSADIDAQAPKKAMEAVARRRAPKVDPTEHDHGDGRCMEPWIDEDGRRRTRPAQGRVPKYVFSCKACQAEDRKRLDAPATLTEDDAENTVFMIPENATDAKVAREYLKKRYPGMELFIMDTIRPERLALRPGSKVVVLSRRALPGARGVGLAIKQSEDKEGRIVDVQVPPEEHIAEIVESAPVVVAECVASSSATMFEDATVDISELGHRLGEHALPRHYIASYQRVVGSDEQVFTLRSL